MGKKYTNICMKEKWWTGKTVPKVSFYYINLNFVKSGYKVSRNDNQQEIYISNKCLNKEMIAKLKKGVIIAYNALGSNG